MKTRGGRVVFILQFDTMFMEILLCTTCSDKCNTNLCGCNIHLFIEHLTKRKQILSKRLILQHLQHKFFFIHHTHQAS